jgi:hypothetical protein
MTTCRGGGGQAPFPQFKKNQRMGGKGRKCTARALVIPKIRTIIKCGASYVRVRDAGLQGDP